jgi:small-conductance mechanosensitive channel
MFDSLVQSLKSFLGPVNLLIIIKIAAIVLIGLLVVRLFIFFIKKGMKTRFSPQSVMIVRKMVFYSGLFIIVLLVLKQLNVKLAALLGAAGIAGIAIGFASQTSLSNIISGIFLISEKTFAVGDVIKVDGSMYIVLSVDLLSVKARTFDNQYVRIPNEKLIKTEVTNVTKFPVRRIDFNLSVAYKEDLSRVREVLLDIARENQFCLNNPEPLFLIKDFGDSGIEILLGLWLVKTDVLALRNSIMLEIKQRFDREGIEIPYPHISVYTGSATDAFPLTVIEGEEAPLNRKKPENPSHPTSS